MRLFCGKSNREISCADLDSHPDCVFWFSPGAYLYYSPGIYAATISEGNNRILVISSIIKSLDRSNASGTRDGFFAKRWPLLNREECIATQKWLLWLSQFGDNSFDEISLGRAFDTIEIIAGQDSADPIAKRAPRS